MKKAIVIGAGFGGIAAAIRLKKKGYKTPWVVKSRIEQINLENNEK